MALAHHAQTYHVSRRFIHQFMLIFSDGWVGTLVPKLSSCIRASVACARKLGHIRSNSQCGYHNISRSSSHNQIVKSMVLSLRASGHSTVQVIRWRFMHGIIQQMASMCLKVLQLLQP